MDKAAEDKTRFVAIFVKCEGGYLRAPFDIAKFDGTMDDRGIVPNGNDHGKVFDEIWKLDTMPFAKKTSFGGPV